MTLHVWQQAVLVYIRLAVGAARDFRSRWCFAVALEFEKSAGTEILDVANLAPGMEVTSPPSLVYQQLVWRAASPLSAFQWTVQDSAALDLNAVPPFHCVPVRKGRHFWFRVPARSICCWTPRTAAEIVGVCLGQAMSEDAARMLQPFWQTAGSYIHRLAFDDSDLMVTTQQCLDVWRAAKLAFWPLLHLTSNTFCNCILHVHQCHRSSMTAQCLNYNWYQWKATVTRSKSSEFLLPLLAPFQDFFGLDNHDPHQRPLLSSIHMDILSTSWLKAHLVVIGSDLTACSANVPGLVRHPATCASFLPLALGTVL